MTFMLSSVRNLPFPDVSLGGTSDRPTSNKRKSLCLLPSSSPTKVIRIGRFSSLLSASASSNSSSTLTRDLDCPATRKSPPTCTVSLENVTVNTCSENSRSTSLSPLDVVDINVIPFPCSTSSDMYLTESDADEKQTQLPFAGRRRRSNHLLLRRASSSSSSASSGHRRSISSAHKKENSTLLCRPSPSPSSFKPSIRSIMPPPPISSSAELRQSKPKLRRERGDIKFTAMVRRSVMQSLISTGKEELDSRGDRMDVDEEHVAVVGSGSITYDILNDEADAYDRETLTMQDQLLVDRLGRHLTEWGYRESLPAAPHTFSSPIHISPVSRAPAPSVAVSTISTVVPTPTFASTVSFAVSSAAPEVMVIERPGSPVAQLLSKADSDTDSGIPSPSSPPCQPGDALVFDPLPSPSHAPIPLSVPIPIPVSPPPRISSPSPASASGGRVLTPPQLVATLVLRHRDKTAVRSRGSTYDGCSTSSGEGERPRSVRRPSPLACEL